jgi:protein-disulfide isomerase
MVTPSLGGKHSNVGITVAANTFTDVDCPFCKRLHAQVPKMNELGITVKYLASPIAFS